MRVREADIVRSASRNTLKRRAEHRDPAQRGRARASVFDDKPARSQEQLWADCVAEQPDIISDIVHFIAGARAHLIESPPVAPADDEPKSDQAERPRRK